MFYTKNGNDSANSAAYDLQSQGTPVFKSSNSRYFHFTNKLALLYNLLVK